MSVGRINIRARLIHTPSGTNITNVFSIVKLIRILVRHRATDTNMVSRSLVSYVLKKFNRSSEIHII